VLTNLSVDLLYATRNSSGDEIANGNFLYDRPIIGKNNYGLNNFIPDFEL